MSGRRSGRTRCERPTRCRSSSASTGAGSPWTYPDALRGKPIVYVAYNHSGAGEDVERDLAGLRAGSSAGVGDRPGSASYLEVQTAHDLVLGFGRRSFLLGANADDVRPEALEELVELVGDAPGEGTFSATAMGGAIGRVPRTRPRSPAGPPRST